MSMPPFAHVSVMGNDYYATNEHMVMSDLSIRRAGEVFGWYLVTRQYYARYRRPVMHTETNTLNCTTDPPDWLWKQWQQLQRWGMHLLEYGSGKQIARASAKTADGAALAAAGVAALAAGARRLARH